jgi:DNA repair exonuclease SbcCD ATPase subunit
MMPVWFRSQLKLLVAVLLVLSFCMVEASAQTRKKRRSRRASKPVVAKPVITNPVIAPPGDTVKNSSGDVKIISTADLNSAEADQETETPSTKKTRNTKAATDGDDMQQTISTLSNQVNKLTDKLTQMQEDDRYLMDMERLTRAEQRSESLRSNLIDVQSKMADLSSRLEQIEYSLKPENIERATMTYGTVHPEEARESRRRQLESERQRVQAQIAILETSRVRLEGAIATADAEVDLLRARLNQQRDQDALAPKSDTSRPAKARKPPQ